MQEDAAAITSFQGAGIVLKEWNNIGRFGLRDFACFGQLDVEVARCSLSCRVWRPFLSSFNLSSSFLTPLLLRGCVLEGYTVVISVSCTEMEVRKAIQRGVFSSCRGVQKLIPTAEKRTALP